MKSHVSDQLTLLRCIYEDACSKCTADVSDLRDWITIESRVKEEGLSFLTITLPEFCKSLDRGLASGYIDSTYFPGFRKCGAIPSFLKGMLSQIFDRETGRLKQNEFPRTTDSGDLHVYVEAIRQICRAFTKLEIDCSPERVEKAVEGFVSTERDLAAFSISKRTRERFARVSSILWSSALLGFSLEELRPRHGPGATADGRRGNTKYIWLSWPQRLEDYFPFFPNAYSLSAYGEKVFDDVQFIRVGEELPVKVTPVPKTQKGPRIIAVEPTAMQYAQQAVLAWLVPRIERSRYSAGHVNFTDQSINQRIAMRASIDKSEATIDLSDASDRVPLELVELMFRSSLGRDPLLWETIMACRSTHAKLPDGRVIGPLKKFASMGSALCFPVEAMYFYTSCVEALLEIKDLPVTPENVFRVSRDVYVYGDDIIVPQTNAVAVIQHLASYNCKVNLNKSFWNGNFRESCGVDAFEGKSVTPTYVRKLHPDSRRDADSIASFVATANLFYQRGYWKTAHYLFEVVERQLGSLPFVGNDSSVLGRVVFRGLRSIGRWHEGYQRFEVKGWVTAPSHRTDELDGYPALQKCLLALENAPSGTLVKERDEHHLERTARYGVVALKRRWAEVR